MTLHSFTLNVQGELGDEETDALFEAGADDSTISGNRRYWQLHFDRERDSFARAVYSAVQEVETVSGLTVVSIENDELVWASEIAERIGRSRQSIDMLIDGRRGPGGFPEPAVVTRRNPLWNWADVAVWLAAYGIPVEADSERAAVIAVINGALQIRRNLATVEGPASDILSDATRRLVGQATV